MMRIAAHGAIFGLALIALPASAQYYQTEVVPPTIVKLGTHSSPVAGTGQVRVQVLVRPDGSHVVSRIISSTNHGDDAAAREIAESSTYRPATRGGKAIIYYYDPIFKFSGKTVAGFEGLPPTQAASGGNATIDAMLRSGRYSEAQSAAQSALTSRPNDPELLQELGVADYYLKDYEGAAAAFYKVSAIARIYQTVAASSFANAAAHLGSEVNASTEDETVALAYARRAIALDPGPNSQFALGVAEIGDKQYAQGLATLQAVHSTVFGRQGTPVDVKYAIDNEMLVAYIGMSDLNGAQETANEMMRLKPGDSRPAESVCQIYINQGQTALSAKNYQQAISLFEKAASFDDPQCRTAGYDRAANAVDAETKPDASQIKAYADKALAVNANDPVANMFEGVALYFEYQSVHSAQLKSQSLTYLNKADSLAKAAGNQSLVQTIETFIRQVNSAGGM